MACEICGAKETDVGCWCQCPLHFDSICHRHCYSCEYHVEAASMAWCGFWGESFRQEEKESGESP